MSSTKTFSVTKNYMGTINDGGWTNPGDLHMPIGRWDPATGLDWESRAAVYAPVSFSGMTKIVSAHLHLDAHTASGWHAHGTGGATLYALRKTSDWGETTGGASSSVNETWGQHGTAVVASGVAAVESGDLVNMSGSPSDGSDVAINITSIVRDWFEGSPNYGIVIKNATSESSASAAKEFYSRHASGHVPYIEIEYETNTPPNAPTNLSPSANAVTSSGVLHFTHSDPDSGDKMTSAEIYLYDSAGSLIKHISGSSIIGDGINGSWQAYPLVSGDRYQWKVRTYDGAAWGPFSALQSFYYEPAQPAPSLSSPASGATVTTLTPTFSATQNLSGDSTMAHAQVQVFNSTGGTLIWDSGSFSEGGSLANKVYSGPALAWSTTYQWRMRVQTSLGTWSSWSGKRSFTTDAAGAPKNVFPSNEKVDSTTPHIGFDAASGDTIQSWDYEVYESNGSTLHSSASGVTTDISNGTHVDHVYGGTALQTGKTYYVRFRYTASVGGLGAWSAKQSFSVNAPPSAPTLKSPASGSVITDLTPQFEWTFQDPDKSTWGDTQQAYTLEVRDAATDALIASLTGTTAQSRVYDGAALAYDTTYKWRVQTSDGTATGAWSSYRTFKPSQAPVLSSFQPDDASVADPQFRDVLITPTPTYTWVFTGSGGKPQATYRIRVLRSSDQALIYDTGDLSGAETSYIIPNGVLENAEVYDFTLDATDSDGLAAAQVSDTNESSQFPVPAALTGISTTADPDTSKITVSWDQTADPNFDHYEVWRRVYQSGDDWTVLDSNLVVGQESYDDYTAALNTTYEYAVLQVAAEGASLIQGQFAPVTSQISNAISWYFVAENHEDLTVELLWVDGRDESIPIQQQKFEALGRRFKIVVEGEVLGSEGTLSLVIDASETHVSDRIEALLRSQLPRVLVKSPEGRVYASKLGSIKRTYGARGRIALSIDYTQIEDA